MEYTGRVLKERMLAVFAFILVFVVSQADAKLWSYPTYEFNHPPHVSFASDGEWVPVTPEKKHLCTDQWICSPDENLIFVPKDPNFVIYNKETACKKFVDNKVSRVTFLGDSYMRQMYSGMLITMLGNYKNGSLVEHDYAKNCQYESMFNERLCGVQLLNHYKPACDGQLLLDPLLTGLDNLNMCENNKKNIVVWSLGNHMLRKGDGGRVGVNNATMYSEYFSKHPCPSVALKDLSNCSIYWISTHYRMIGWFGDETPEYVNNYNVGMREFFDNGGCSNVGYIDVYNMTRALGMNHANEAVKMTYDKVHWGMRVNLVKAQIILNSLFRDTKMFKV